MLIKKLPWFDLAASSCLIIYSVIIWLPTRAFPFHWDSAGFVINALENLRQTNFNPPVITGSDFAHPPLFIFLAALIWKVFSQSILAQHLINLPFFILFLVSNYYLSKKILTPYLSFIIAILVGLMPIVLAEYGVIYLDLPTAALITLSLALYLSKKTMSSFIVFSLALLTKETAILALPFFILMEYPKKSLKGLSYLLSLGPLLLYYCLHYLQTGWWLIKPETAATHRFAFNFNELSLSVQFVFQELFIYQFRWVITAAFIVAIVMFYQKHHQISEIFNNKIINTFIGIITSSFVFFIFMSEFSPRYVLFVLPLMLIVSVYYLGKLLPQITLGVLLFLFCLVNLFSWYPSPSTNSNYEFRPPEDLGYQEMIHVFRSLSAYLSVYEPQSLIYGAFPENLYLTQTYQGYVKKPLNYYPCTEYKPDKSKRSVLVIHPYSPGQITCRGLMDQYQFTPIKRFESYTKWVELYELSALPATPSAKPTTQKP
jgi:Gpi18-like mannosyltransferase